MHPAKSFPGFRTGLESSRYANHSWTSKADGELDFAKIPALTPPPTPPQSFRANDRGHREYKLDFPRCSQLGHHATTDLEPQKGWPLTPPDTPPRPVFDLAGGLSLSPGQGCSTRYWRRLSDCSPPPKWALRGQDVPVKSYENRVFLTSPDRLTQVDGMDDDVEMSDISPIGESSISGSLAKLNMDENDICKVKDADGDIRLPDASSESSCSSEEEIQRRTLSIDLTNPFNAAFPSPGREVMGTPTPLVQASQAADAYPFPQQERKTNILSPLTIRDRSSMFRIRGGSQVRERIASKGLDRFIPSRKSPKISMETLRLSTPAAHLSEVERVTRQRHPEFDPFGQHVPRSTRTQSYQNLQGAIRPTGGLTSRNLEGPFALRHGSREVSNGAVWNVGGSAIVTDSVPGIPDGRGGMLSSGTNAPLHTTMFLSQTDSRSAQEEHERRLAHAMDIDQSSRVLGSFNKPANPSNDSRRAPSWIDSQWIREGCTTSGFLPIIEFLSRMLTRNSSEEASARKKHILDAPRLRDDFYCTVLAYSHTANCLAVGLAHSVYLWSETRRVGTPESINANYTAHVTSLSFSSNEGGQAILAIGRADGSVCLWSMFDEEPRFKARQPAPISCLSFGPNTAKQPSLRDSALVANAEILLIGDDEGHVYLFSIEWPDVTTRDLFNWPGAMTLLARINVHTQQICGLTWSPYGEFFASGGNDNQCFLFETKRLFAALKNPHETVAGVPQVTDIDATAAKHRWTLNAAVKAMAFCPWQLGLLAIGGGSNDRCIHFYHTFSGACLATIDCSAQVTSLIWSMTRREICATFGFAQPDHPFRIAVFSWPACEQLVAIPWPDDHRALYAVAYPGGPNDGRTRGEGGAWWSRTQVEGCIVVATSDTSIKFHEVWSQERRKAKPLGPLGGSEILEELHGADRQDWDVIR